MPGKSRVPEGKLPCISKRIRLSSRMLNRSAILSKWAVGFLSVSVPVKGLFRDPAWWRAVLARKNRVGENMSALPSKEVAPLTLDAVHAEASTLNLTPGWLSRKKPILWPQPNPEFAPAHWGYEAARAILDTA